MGRRAKEKVIPPLTQNEAWVLLVCWKLNGKEQFQLPGIGTEPEELLFT